VLLRRQAQPDADEIAWIVAIESSQRNAFQGPNMRSLDEALATCEAILRQRWYNEVQGALLDAVDQALVLVDRAGKIRLTNQRANILFGGSGDQLFGKTLATFSAKDGDKRALESSATLSQACVTLSIDQGVTVPVLATHRPLEDDYGYRLWLFTDLREQGFKTELKYLEQRVSEVAQNTRAAADDRQ
jgi:PAS domain S-box-containing protein